MKHSKNMMCHNYGNCIYFGKRDGLHFDSEEHIFPCSLGGRDRLPKEAVSKEANNYFSKYEKRFCNHGAASFARLMLNPPSRQKMNRSDNDIVLGGGGNPLFQYALHDISGTGEERIEGIQPTQIFIRKDGTCNMRTLAESDQEPAVQIEEGRRKLEDIIDVIRAKLAKENGGFKFYQTDLIDQGDILLGFDGRIIVAARERPTKEELVRRLPDKRAVKASAMHRHEEYDTPPMQMQFEIGVDETIVAAKTAFNVMACVNGIDTLREEAFDEIRERLTNPERHMELHKETAHPPISPSFLSFIHREVPDSHICLVTQDDNGEIFAYVLFFGAFLTCVHLGKASIRIRKGIYLCDWRRSKEMWLDW